MERRQVIELEKPQRKVLEHRGQSVRCPQCGVLVDAAFPPGVTAPVQYGTSVQAAVVYLHAAQLIPSQRTAQIMADLCACPLSPGSVSTMVQRAGAGAQQVTCEIKQRLLQEPWISFDETGLSLSGRNHWLHTASSPLWTLLHVHEKRGEEGIAAGGVLPHYTGKAIHDFLPAYLRFEQCSHGLCNAHHLRDLTFVHEVFGQSWAQHMIEYLLEAKKLSDKRRGQGRKVTARELEQMQDRYVEIIELAYEQNPEPPPKQPGQRGRPARGKALNLADRFAIHDQKVMAFLLDEDTPFDNNHAERDVRMMKVRQKISGCFRSEEMLHAFASVRSVMSTAAKHAVGVFHAIKVLFAPQPSLELVLADEASGT